MPSNPIQFGTEQFTAATGGRSEGIPDHAAMIEGKLIHLDTKNLKGWGVTEKATKQILGGIRGIPIRACNNPDPHACDYDSDNFANVGYATDVTVEDGWIIAKAAITDKAAAKKVNDKTWMPFGKGGWSVTGFPSDPTPDFKISGLTDGFAPASIALILGNGKPAFEGSGFEMVAAAINNYKGTNMPEKPEGGNEPVTYNQEALDKIVKDALAKQKTDDVAAVKKTADAEIAKQKADFEDKSAGMTSKDDMKTILEAHGKKVQADTLDTIKRSELMTEYKDVMQRSPVAGAPFMQEGKFSQELFNAEMPTLEGLQIAALSGMVDKAKMVAAAVPGTDFHSLEYPNTPPGSDTQESKDMTVCNRMIGVI